MRLRGAPAADFEATLANVTARLELMAEGDRERWLLLSYIEAMIYHNRPGEERPALRNVILRSVRSDPRRRELETMFKTGADMLREEGELLGAIRSRQDTLVRQLRLRFGRVPRAVERAIRTTQDTAQLDAWLDAILTAQSLSQMGITTAE